MTLKLKKTRFFACNCVKSSHRIRCNASIERSHQGFHFFFLLRQALSNIIGHDQKDIKIRRYSCALGSLIDLFLVCDFSLKPQTNQSILTLKVIEGQIGIF